MLQGELALTKSSNINKMSRWKQKKHMEEGHARAIGRDPAHQAVFGSLHARVVETEV